MPFAKFSFILVTPILAAALTAAAQQALTSPDQAGRTIQLDVVVAPNSGAPVSGLSKNDFTVRDNGAPAAISSFQEVTPAQVPVRVIFLVDAVNASYTSVGFQRSGVADFLARNAGKLAQPSTIAFLTDNGVQIGKDFTTDGHALNQTVQQYAVGLRQIHRNSQWGAADRVQISLNGLRQIVEFSRSFPGKKLLIWISPGWPLLSGPEIYLDGRQQSQLFSDIVSYSTQLRLAGVTLYNLNPIGVSEPLARADYYESFLKGVRRQDQTQIGNLGLQVLAVQSGGLAIESNSDINGMIQRCMQDAAVWYQISIEAPEAERPNQYHQVTVNVNRPGMTARTRTGYYAQP